jgi:hypothetical protein
MRNFFIVVTALAGLASGASATTFSGIFTADDGVAIYLGTAPGTLGTQVGDNGLATFWGTQKTLTAASLTPGVTNYLQVIARDDTAPGMFLGGFTLSDTGFQFANGTQTLVSDLTNWKGRGIAGLANWAEPTGTVSEMNNSWGLFAGFTWPTAFSAAKYIWPTDSQSGGTACGSCFVALMAVITPTSTTQPSVGIPEPLTAGLLGAGLLGLGLVRRRG